jgi:hypothetical protein
MSTGAKLAVVGAAIAVTAVLVGFYTWNLTVQAGSPAYTVPVKMVNGHPVVDLTIQTVAAIGPKLSENPDWVSYLVLTTNGWKRETVWDLPANATVHVTDYNFDGASGLRNPLFGRMYGVTAGGKPNTVFLDGKRVSAIDPDTASHVFAVSSLGIVVAFQGVGDNAKNQCGPEAPCPLSNAHTTTKFAFHTTIPGHFRWQCFVPCAAGWIDGWGGPMQTIGYMDGFLNVSA